MAFNFDGFSTILQSLVGVNQTRQGVEMQVNGANLSADAYRTSAASTLQVANYNAAVERLNNQRELDVFGRQIREFMSSQQVASASSGAALTSKSYLAVANASMDSFARQIRQSKSASEQRQKEILFEGQLQATNLENQARAANYQADIAAYQGRTRQTNQLVGIASQVGSLLF